MKINTFISIASFLLVFVYLLVFNIDLDEFDDMARFVPDSALLYVEQSNGGESLLRFSKSPLGKAFESIDFSTTGVEIGISEVTQKNIDGLLAVYEKAKENILIHEFLGKKLVISVLSPLNDSEIGDFKKFVENNTVFITEPLHNAQILEFLTEKYLRSEEKKSFTTTQYGNHQIKRIKIGERVLAVVRIDGLFICSFNERQLRLCIDTYDLEGSPLKERAEFSQIKKRAQNSDRLIFLDLENLRHFFGKSFQDKDFYGSTILSTVLKKTESFGGLAQISWPKKMTVESTVIATFDSDKIDRSVGKFLTVPSTYNTMTEYFLPESMVYYWSNTLDVTYLLDYFEAHFASTAQVDIWLSDLKRKTNVDVRNILSLLGGQSTFIALKGVEENFFELPLGLTFFKLKDPAQFTEQFNKLVSSFNVPIISETYLDVTCNYWALSPQEGFFPLYGFLGEYFFIGNSLTLFKKVINSQKTGMSVAKKSRELGINPGFQNRNNSMAYMNNREVLRVLRKTLKMVSTVIAIEDKEVAQKVRILVDKIVSPLLTGAEMYSMSGRRSYFTSDMVVIESITTVQQ